MIPRPQALKIARILAGVCVSGGLIYFLYSKKYPPIVSTWGIYQRFRYRADFGAEPTVTMSEEGLGASGPHVQGKWDWPAYPSAVRHPDGIMLLRRGVIRWLPDSALLVGTPEDATALVRSKSTLRELN